MKPKVKIEIRKLERLIRKSGNAVKKELKPVAKDVLTNAKAAAPVYSTALSKSLGMKPIKGGWLVGAKQNFEFEDAEGVIHRPLLYAGKIDEATGFLSDQLAGVESKMMAAVKKAINVELKQG